MIRHSLTVTCANCGKAHGDHRRGDMHCPVDFVRSNAVSWHATQGFESAPYSVSAKPEVGGS